MRRTVNDKYPWIVGILVLVYAGWVVTSAQLAQATHLGWSHHNQKVALLNHEPDPTGLIFGGSNASFSLSAEELSSLSGDTWFNASLMNEGFSFENQTEFVRDVARSVDPDTVTTVVLSSIRHVQGGRTDNLFTTNIQRDGEPIPPLWLPYSSLAGLVVDPLGMPYETLVTDSGDLVHSATRECRPGNRARPIEWADNARIDDMLVTWLPLLGSNFPNASVAVTIPGQFLVEPAPAEETSAYVARLTDRIGRWQRAHPGVVSAPISVIVEPNVYDRSLVCSTSHHLNEKGRTARTAALYALLNEQGVINGR